MKIFACLVAALVLTLASGCALPATQTEEAASLPTEPSNGLIGKRWRPVEINGRAVPSLERAPYFILQAEGNRVVGFGGCNDFSGTYTLQAPVARIRFGQITSTLKACVTGMDVEQAFQDALGRADNYSLNGTSLTLNRARMAPLARFEAVDAT